MAVSITHKTKHNKKIKTLCDTIRLIFDTLEHFLKKLIFNMNRYVDNGGHEEHDFLT
jgi:hypothetical protein